MNQTVVTSPRSCPLCKGSRRVIRICSTDGMFQGIHFTYERCRRCHGTGTRSPVDAARPGRHQWPLNA